MKAIKPFNTNPAEKNHRRGHQIAESSLVKREKLNPLWGEDVFKTRSDDVYSMKMFCR